MTVTWDLLVNRLNKHPLVLNDQWSFYFIFFITQGFAFVTVYMMNCGQTSCLVSVCGHEERCRLISLWLHVCLHMCTLKCEGLSSAVADFRMNDFNSNFKAENRKLSLFSKTSHQFSEKLILSVSLRAWIYTGM